MSTYYAHVDAGKVTTIIKASAPFIETLVNADEWHKAPRGVAIGWSFDGTDFTDRAGNSPPVRKRARTVRKLLTPEEWRYTWTPEEWRALKTMRAKESGTGKKLDHLLDAIDVTGSVNLRAPRMIAFYEFIVESRWVTQERADELQAGI